MADTLLLTAEPGHFKELKKELYDSGRVTWIVDKRKTRKSFSDMFRSMVAMIDTAGILIGTPGNYMLRKLFESMMKTDSYVFRMKFDPLSSVLSFFLGFSISMAAWLYSVRI